MRLHINNLHLISYRFSVIAQCLLNYRVADCRRHLLVILLILLLLQLHRRHSSIMLHLSSVYIQLKKNLLEDTYNVEEQ